MIKRPDLVGTGPAAGSWVDGGSCSTGGRTGVLFALVGGVAERLDSLLEFFDQLIVRGVRAPVGVVHKQLGQRLTGREGPIRGSGY